MMAAPTRDAPSDIVDKLDERVLHRVWGKVELLSGSSNHSSSGIDSHESHVDRPGHVIFIQESSPSDFSDVSSTSGLSGRSHGLQEPAKNDQGSHPTTVMARVGSKLVDTVASNSDFPVIDAPTVLGSGENQKVSMEQMRAQLSLMHMHEQQDSRHYAADDADEQGYSATDERYGHDTYVDDEQVGNDHGEMMSLGSQLHGSGACKPCLYLNSRASCTLGRYCRFCHLPHPKKKHPRPCKAKRTQCKQIVNMLSTVFGPDSEQFQEASQKLSSESQYMRSILDGAKKSTRGNAMNKRMGSGMPAGVGNLDPLVDRPLPERQHHPFSAGAATIFQ